MNKITVKKLSDSLGLKFKGNPDTEINFPATCEFSGEGKITWARDQKTLDGINAGIVVVNKDLASYSFDNLVLIYSDHNPRFVFSKILTKYFSYLGMKLFNDIANHRQNSHITIADNCYIGSDVKIGEGTSIYPNVVVHNNARIGQNCTIRTGSIIGAEGSGYEKDENGNWYRMPQIGGITIKNNVEIAAGNVIGRGTIENTFIDNHSKIGVQNNIAHNVRIGKNCFIAGSCGIAGSVSIEDNCWIGLGAIIRESLHIGKESTIGVGAVVIKDVPPSSTMVGNPARIL